jgi:hypothetical protein
MSGRMHVGPSLGVATNHATVHVSPATLCSCWDSYPHPASRSAHCHPDPLQPAGQPETYSRAGVVHRLTAVQLQCNCSSVRRREICSHCYPNLFLLVLRAALTACVQINTPLIRTTLRSLLFMTQATIRCQNFGAWLSGSLPG